MKKSQGMRLLEKALSNVHIASRAGERVAYSFHDNSISEMNGADVYVISQELKRNKKAIINSAAYKTAMKKIAKAAEKELIELINETAGYHETNIKNRQTKLQANIATETFFQAAAKKLNKKELAQLKKLLPLDNNIAQDIE